MTISFALPPDAVSNVKKGDHIEPDDVLFSVHSSELITIQIAERLHIKPEAIFHYLSKIIGEEITKGDILAQKKGNLFSHKVVAEHNGLLKEIDHHSGSISLLVANNEQNGKKAGFRGDVEDINDNKISINIKNGVAIHVKNISGNGAGEIFYFESEGMYFSTSQEDLENKIIFIQEIKQHIAAKCEALGCVGFIYVKGEVKTDLPTAQFKTDDDYNLTKEKNKKYTIFSLEDKEAIVYD
jgi:hypothetical protein